MAKNLATLEELKRLYTLKDYAPEALPKIQVLYADVLSRKLYYADCQFAIGILRLMGRKAFTHTELEVLRLMGFTVEVGVRKIELPVG